MKIYEFEGKTPRIGRNCMIADSVEIIGDVQIGDNCSIWPGVVIRCDTTPVYIGNNVHIEENSILHTATHIEDDVMVGHGCCIEGFIGTNTLIGNTASLMPFSRVGSFCAVSAGAVVLDRAIMPDHSFITGVPAKVHSAIDPENPAHAMRLASTYIGGEMGIAQLAQRYIRQGLWAVNCEEVAAQ